MLHPHAAVRFHCETSEFSFVSFTGAYYCLNMIMITLSTFLSVIVINLYFRGDKRNRVPRWLKIVSSICISEMLTVCEVWFSAKYTQLSSNTISPSPNNSPEGIFRPKRTTGKSTALDFERLLFWLLQKKKEKKKKKPALYHFLPFWSNTQALVKGQVLLHQANQASSACTWTCSKSSSRDKIHHNSHVPFKRTDKVDQSQNDWRTCQSFFDAYWYKNSQKFCCFSGFLEWRLFF